MHPGSAAWQRWLCVDLSQQHMYCKPCDAGSMQVVAFEVAGVLGWTHSYSSNCGAEGGCQQKGGESMANKGISGGLGWAACRESCIEAVQLRLDHSWHMSAHSEGLSQGCQAQADLTGR